MDNTLQTKPGRGKALALGALIIVFCASLSVSVLPYNIFSPAFAYSDISIMKEADQSLTVEVLRAAKKGNWIDARRIIQKTKNPLAIKLYNWLYYTQSGRPLDFESISYFIEKNPDWPLQKKLAYKTEENFPSSMADLDVVAWFSQHEPQTAEGMERYLQSLMGVGQRAKAQNLIRKWWREALFKTATQNRFIVHYGSMIDRPSHVARFGFLMKKDYYTNARTIARILGGGYPALAEARIALAKGQGGVDQAIKRVPAHLRNDSGLMLERLKWRRRNNKNTGAVEILHNAPQSDNITDHKGWWRERNIMIRRSIDRGQYETAYLLAQNHRQPKGLGFAESEFLAGWLALEFLKKPKKAFKHFETLYYGTSTPISRSRGAYWAGHTSQSMGYVDISIQWYEAAARHQTAFYGQLAMFALNKDARPKRKVPPTLTLKGTKTFQEKELVQAVRLLNQAGLGNETSVFLQKLAGNMDIPEDYRLTAELAEELGHPQNAVRIAKKGLQKDILLMDQAYPTMLTYMKKVPVEWALVHSLIRQESNFDYRITSPAGARGLMQLMPGTAQDVARKHKISHRTAWLTENKGHNIRLGSLYLKQMLARYDDSYPLALAAYNAGPGRVDKWLKQFGDPRKGQISLVNWIERIPYNETRNYVQRVLEGVYTYRTKLKDVQNIAQSPIHVSVQSH